MIIPIALAWTVMAAALTPPPPRHPDQEASVIKWVEDYLDTEDWIDLSWSEDTVRFTSGAGATRTAEDRVRLWVREEFFEPEQTEEGVFRSLMILTEFDCGEGRIRQLAADAYPYNNLGGEKWTYDEQAAEWSYVRPATVAEYELGVICDWMAEADATPAEGPAPGGLWREGGQ